MTTPRQPRLVVLGDLLLDVVVTPERPVERGTDVPGRISFRRGGSAANVAAAFVRAGGTATLITSLGDDRLGSRLAASLRADGVRVRAVRQRGRQRSTGRPRRRAWRAFVRDAARCRRPPPAGRPRARLAPRRGHPARAGLLALRRAHRVGGRARRRSRAHEAGVLVSADLSSRGPLVSVRGASLVRAARGAGTRGALRQS